MILTTWYILTTLPSFTDYLRSKHPRIDDTVVISVAERQSALATLSAFQRQPGAAPVDDTVRNFPFHFPMNVHLGGVDPTLPSPWLFGSDYLYDKLFQHALKPFKIVPFLHRMTYPVQPHELTLTSLITIERLDVLNRLALKWRGFI